MPDTLEELRHQIDNLDTELIATLSKRMGLVKQVATFKKEHGLPPLQPARWEEVMNARVAQAQSLGLSEDLVKEIMDTIHKHALSTEEAIVKQ